VAEPVSPDLGPYQVVPRVTALPRGPGSCGHHYRASRASLAKAGAEIYVLSPP